MRFWSFTVRFPSVCCTVRLVFGASIAFMVAKLPNTLVVDRQMHVQRRNEMGGRPLGQPIILISAHLDGLWANFKICDILNYGLPYDMVVPRTG